MQRKVKAELYMSLLSEEEEEEEDIILQNIQKKRKRTRDIYKNRNSEGCFVLLIRQHLLHDEGTYREFFRLNPEQVDFVLSLVGNNLRKQSTTTMKRPITPHEKLLMTLRFLVTGKTYRSLSFVWRISNSYINVIIREVLEELRSKLTAILLPQPNIASFEKISKDFFTKWNFPNCVGAIDGKHVRIVSPANSGSLYFNYKNYFSIVLLALVDANYKFIVTDIGSYGKEGDSEIFNKSVMGRRINSGTFPFPRERCLPQTNIVAPHVIIGDEAFKLSKHMLKPFLQNQALEEITKLKYNERLCRVRRVSENAFGLLAQQFRIFYAPIAVSPPTVDSIIAVTCCLHNLLHEEYIEKNTTQKLAEDISPNMRPLAAVDDLENIEGFQVRDVFCSYFNSPEGDLEWNGIE